MNLTRFPVNPFEVLTYILWTDDGGEAAIVDPGMMTDDERDMIVGFLDSHRLTLRHILLTHIHIDHVASAQWMADRYRLPLEGGKGDEMLGALLPQQVAMFHLKLDLPPVKLGRCLVHGDTIMLGDEEIQVREVPGHSAGSLVFYLPASNILISGDTLFAGSIGRTDLPGGDYDVLTQAIHTQLFTLPDDTVVYPGHGPETTIGDERQYNPFFT